MDVCCIGGVRFGMGAKKRGSGGLESPIGMGSGGQSPPETEEFLKVVRSKFYAFLGVVYHTFSPTYAYGFPYLQASFH